MNYASTPNAATPSWVFDTGASNHVTTNLNNMHLYSEYNGLEEVQIGDGTGLKISHVGSTTLPTPTTMFNLRDVLFVPHAKHNLISVSKFCKSNKAYIEFHPSFFCVKDQGTGATLMHGPSNGDLYTYRLASPPSPIALSTTCTSSSLWHSRFGHPSSRVLAQGMPYISQSAISFNYVCFEL